MAARTFIIDSGGTAREPERFFIIDSGGTARHIQRAFIIDSGGTARLIYNYAIVSFPNGPYIAGTDNTTLGEPPPTFTVGNDGFIDINSGAFGEAWVTPVGAASQFEVRLSSSGAVVGSPSISGSALDTWLSCSTSRTWTNTAVATESNNHALEIRRASDSVVVASTTVSLIFA